MNTAEQMYLYREPGCLILELDFGGLNPSVQSDISLGSCVGKIVQNLLKCGKSAKMWKIRIQ